MYIRRSLRTVMLTLGFLGMLLGGAPTASAEPEPLSVSLTIDATGSYYRSSGTIVLSGTMSCTGSPTWTDVGGDMLQITGRFRAQAWGYANATCNEPWTATFYTYGSITFVPGSASVTMYGYLERDDCEYLDDGGWDCHYDDAYTAESATVRLRQVR